MVLRRHLLSRCCWLWTQLYPFWLFQQRKLWSKKGWHQWSLSLTDRIVTELNVHHHKDNIINFLKKQTTWLNTYWGQSRCRWTHHLSAEPSPDNRRGKSKNVCWWWNKYKIPQPKNTIKNQEPNWVLNTIWSPAELCPGFFFFWVVLVMLVKVGST